MRQPHAAVNPIHGTGLRRRALWRQPVRSRAAYGNSGRLYESSRPPPPRRSSGLLPSDWFTPTQRYFLERRAVPPPPTGLVVPVDTGLRPAKRSAPLLAVLLECLDAGALLGSVGGAAAAIVTEQLTFCLLPLTLPVLALLAGRAARGVRDVRAQEELALLADQVQALSAQVQRSSFAMASAGGVTVDVQEALQPLAILPVLDARLNALEGALNNACRGLATAARDAGAAAGALSRDASVAVTAAERVEQALLSRRDGMEDNLQQALQLASRAASERDAVLRASIVAEILQPLRALSMQFLSIAATAGAAAASSTREPATLPALSGAVQAELTDAQLQTLVAAVGQEARLAASEGAQLAPEQWAAILLRLQSLQETLEGVRDAQQTRAARQGDAGLHKATSAAAPPDVSPRLESGVAVDREPDPAPAMPSRLNGADDAPAEQLAEGNRSFQAWMEEPGAEPERVEVTSGSREAAPLAAAAPTGDVADPSGPPVREGALDAQRAAAPPLVSSDGPPETLAFLMTDGLAALRAGRADAEACARGEADPDAADLADERFAAAATLFTRAVEMCELTSNADDLAAAQGNCGNAWLARARHAMVTGDVQRVGEAEEWLVQAGRCFRAANEAARGGPDGRALTQWGAALALRGALVAPSAPDDAVLLFDAAAEKYTAAAGLGPDTAPGALTALGRILMDRAEALPADRTADALVEAAEVLEEAIRQRPEDGEAIALLRVCDQRVEALDMATRVRRRRG